MNQTHDLDILRKNKRTLTLLIVVFLGPALLALIAFTFFKDQIRLGKSTNFGSFVKNLVVIDPSGMETPLDGKPVDKKIFLRKWTYVYLDQSSCDDICIKNLENQRKAELSQGKEARRVQRIFVLTETQHIDGLKQKMAGSNFLKTQFDNLKIYKLSKRSKEKFIAQFNVSDKKDAEASKRVYIIDPRGRLIMYYPSDTKKEYNLELFKGMVDDLRTLLKRSMIG